MKKVILLLISLFTFQTLIMAQDYTLTVSNQMYTDLDAPVSINNGLTWDDPEFTVPIGFDFQFFDVSINELNFDGDDAFLVGMTADNSFVTFILNAWDMADRGLDIDGDEGEPGSISPLSYQLSGAAGSQIFKLEYNNVGFYSDAYYGNNIFTDFANIQLWLYEADGAIEFRFGESDLTNLEEVFASYNYDFHATYALGHFDDDDYLIGDQGFILNGSAATPTLDVFAQDFGMLDGNIPNGTVYRISQMSTTADNEPNKGNTKIAISPNPTTGLVQVNTNIAADEIESIEILDNNGRSLKSFNNLNTIDISDLPAAFYYLQIQTAEGQWNERVIKY